MKKLLAILILRGIILTVFVLSHSNIEAQITKLKVEDKNQNIVIVYDSLASINKDNYKSHIGQTLYLTDSEFARETGGYSSFYLKPTFSTFEKHYKEVKAKNNYSGTCSDYNYMKGRYFYVDSIIMKPNPKYSFDKDEGYFRLIETESGDTLYYKFNGSFYDFITVGYFEKLKSTYIGKEFICINKRSNAYLGEENIRNLENGTDRTEIPENTILKCIDITVKDDKYSSIIAIVENKEFGKSFVALQDIRDVYTFRPLEDYKKELADIKAHNEILIKKYGVRIGKLIISGKVELGFTKEMCIESLGEPTDINVSTGSYGSHEQWVYDGNRYLYFENGKLTSFQN